MKHSSIKNAALVLALSTITFAPLRAQQPANGTPLADRYRQNATRLLTAALADTFAFNRVVIEKRQRINTDIEFRGNFAKIFAAQEANTKNISYVAQVPA